MIKRTDLAGILKTDARGWAQPPSLLSELGGSNGVYHLASLRPGTVRGGHHHTRATEWLLLFGGPAKLRWSHPESGKMGEEVVAEPTPTIFEIPPGVVHDIVNASNVEIFALIFRDIAEDDTVPAGKDGSA